MGSIAIVGLEPDAAGALDARAAGRLQAADAVVVPSATGAAADAVARLGITPVTFADIGLSERAPAVEVVEALRALADTGDVVLASAGYPFVREGVISGLLARAGTRLDVFPVVSPVQVLMLALDIDTTADLEIIDAGSLGVAELRRDVHLIVTGVDNGLVARAVAGRLAGSYPSEHTVVTAGCRASGGFDLVPLTLAELAAGPPVCRDAALYIPPSRLEPPTGFAELVRIIAILRGDDGCPWDREQTHESLAPHLIEEAYETLSAIESGDPDALADELGDILLQVVLHAEIGAGAGTFSIDDVVASIVTKIRRRHPHIFGTVTVSSAEEVTRNWDAIKRDERPHAGALGEVPDALPALMRAQKISRRAAGVGFEWEDIGGVWEKVHEEIDELTAAAPGGENAAEELGDLLFTIVNVARHMGIDAESALRGTCDKFVRRFEDMEQAAASTGRALGDLEPHEWEILWGQAKSTEAVAGRGPDE
ncbi:MAG: nucleoside triphosphate pyrophosphohydrolase [Coriobacteriia bacterium]|nr:nucleoside triphosphate pyrophosphohydrolase [Coriobacteriia bacterium]